MTEEERNEIISTAENDANLENPEEYREVAMIRIQADIARQLTRIADQKGRTQELEKLLTYASKERKRRIEEIDKLRRTPAPDALVEAVKKTAKSLLIVLGLKPSETETMSEYRKRIIDEYGELGLSNIAQFRDALAATTKAEG